MGRLLDSPTPIIVIVIAALLLFAAPKLPAMARNLGQSMRILRSEIREMKEEGRTKDAAPPGPKNGPDDLGADMPHPTLHSSPIDEQHP